MHLYFKPLLRNLLDMDVFSRSDPMCVVYHHPLGTAHWVELLRTETLYDCLNPDFVTKVSKDGVKIE